MKGILVESIAVQEVMVIMGVWRADRFEGSSTIRTLRKNIQHFALSTAYFRNRGYLTGSVRTTIEATSFDQIDDQFSQETITYFTQKIDRPLVGDY